MTEKQNPVDNPFDLVVDKNISDKKFSDELLNRFQGKIIEVYIGEVFETINFDEASVPKVSSIFGKLIDVYDRFIVLDCYYIDPKTKKLKTDNRIYVNFFQIRLMSELNGTGSLADIFNDATKSEKIRKAILSGL